LAKTKTIENLFVSLAIYSDLLPILLFLIFFNKIRSSKTSWLFVFYLLFDFSTNLSLLYFIPPVFHNNIYSLFTLCESLFFSIFFHSIINKPSFKRFIVAFTVLLSIFSIAYYYFIYFVSSAKQPYLDSMPIGIETISMFIFSFFYFFEQMNDSTNLFIYSKPSFWGVLGILLYLSGSFFIYIFANQISIQELSKYWIITNIASIVKNIFFAIAIYLQATQSIKKPQKNYTLSSSN
jgi:hypothetical protein